MSPSPSLFARLRPWLRQFASLPEPAEFDYPFARSDIAVLQQVEAGPVQLDEQTWDEMLLDAYHAQLATQTSILGQQRLHQRLASGTAGAASRARIAALLASPAQQAVLEQAMQPLRTADREVAVLLCGAAPPAPPWWSRWLLLQLDGRGAFISGQNAIGKSTLLRAMGLNLISARAFGFCYAQTAQVPMLPLYSSMQNEDSFDGGESLYIAELRRARELLALAEAGAPALFLIDEIFRGTNHLESVAAAAAVLHSLAARHLVIVSSHNLVLGPLLEDCLAPWCVRRDEGGALLLAPGVLQATNGIALLAQRGFDAGITDKAGRVFDWLSTHMAQPADCGGVLERA